VFGNGPASANTVDPASGSHSSVASRARNVRRCSSHCLARTGSDQTGAGRDLVRSASCFSSRERIQSPPLLLDGGMPAAAEARRRDARRCCSFTERGRWRGWMRSGGGAGVMWVVVAWARGLRRKARGDAGWRTSAGGGAGWDARGRRLGHRTGEGAA
jgi:hypothetical protein